MFDQAKQEVVKKEKKEKKHKKSKRDSQVTEPQSDSQDKKDEDSDKPSKLHYTKTTKRLPKKKSSRISTSKGLTVAVPVLT